MQGADPPFQLPQTDREETMLAGYIGREVQRTNRNLLITNVLVVVGLAVMWGCASGYVARCIRGPVTITVDQLDSYVNDTGFYAPYVRLAIDREMLDQRYVHVTGGNDHKNDYYLLLHLPRNRSLVIRVFSNHPDMVLTGSLVSMPSEV